VDETEQSSLRAYPGWLRALAAALFAASRANLLVLLLLVLFATDPPVTPPVLARLFLLGAVLPALATWIIGRAVAAEVEVRDATLVVRRRDRRLEVPCAQLGRVVPWTVPLPGPGLWLWTRSRRRLPYGLETEDPTPLLGALAAAGVESARAAAEHPSIVYARARAAADRTRWHHLAGKFVLFALLPAAVLFNAHQHIAYGGTLGQYYLLGPRAYLTTFGVYWGTVSIYLVLYASAWRAAAEGVSLLAARVAPSRAARVRRAGEIGCRVLYYGGVPVLLGLRFLPW
jgi:hypothetical protein